PETMPMPWAEKDMRIVLSEADHLRLAVPLCGVVTEVVKSVKIERGWPTPAQRETKDARCDACARRCGIMEHQSEHDRDHRHELRASRGSQTSQAYGQDLRRSRAHPDRDECDGWSCAACGRSRGPRAQGQGLGPLAARRADGIWRSGPQPPRH